ncbi:barstar family protein [Thermocatellispora tengchongensis]|uniref:barstar family protein n=1 Tax=Thermocatellispora tengchongensis TaxID=1073253 RepID=UPI00363FCE20
MEEVSPAHYASWLHVVQNAWFSAGREGMRYGDTVEWFVDGVEMVNVYGFYCALGEAVNGVGGYFGSNLSALNDCLRKSRSNKEAFRIIWRNFLEFKQRVGDAEAGDILSVFRDREVEVTFL